MTSDVIPASCSHLATEGQHDWLQVYEEIWCEVCGADYDDESVVSKWFALGAVATRRELDKAKRQRRAST